MIVLQFKATGTDLRRTDNSKVVSVTRNNVSAKFEFNSDWSDITPIVAQFSLNGGACYDININNSECLVPWEVLQEVGTLSVSVAGGDLISTNEIKINVYGSGVVGGLVPTVASPSVYKQVSELATEISDKYNGITNLLNTYNDVVNSGINDVTSIASDVAQDALVAQASAIKAETSATKASEALADLKNTVVNIENKAEGRTATATDCSNKKISNIVVYGRSMQKDIPTMDNPQEIADIKGTVEVRVYNENLWNGWYTNDAFSSVTYKWTSERKPGYVHYPCDYGDCYALYIDGVKKECRYRVLDTNGNTIKALSNSTSVDIDVEGACYIDFRLYENLTEEPSNVMFVKADSYKGYVECNLQKADCTLIEPLRAVPCDNVNNANVIIDNKGYIADEICIYNGEIGVLKRVDNTRLTSSDFVEYTHSGIDTTAKKIYQKNLGENYMYAPIKSGLCTHFRVDDKGYTIGDMYFPDRRIIVTVSKDYTLETFKQFLDDNEVYIQLPLAEPIFTAFDEDIQNKFKALQTYKGITNINNSVGAYNKIEYIADTKIYIDNKIKEVAKAIVATESEV